MYSETTRELQVSLSPFSGSASARDTIGRTAARLSHAYYNLITIIQGAAEFLGDELPADDPRQTYVRQLHDAAQRATELTDQLQGLAPRDAGSDVLTDESLRGNEIVLVVEDDAVVCSVVRVLLERYGYTVFDAPNGAHALNMTHLFEGPVDLILTDVDMPELNGAELISALETEGSVPKILMMSGHMPQHLRRKSMAADRYPFIKKPFSHRELATQVRAVLDR